MRNEAHLWEERYFYKRHPFRHRKSTKLSLNLFKKFTLKNPTVLRTVIIEKKHYQEINTPAHIFRNKRPSLLY